jgi:probable F420-dependent oxidoreductase
MKFGVCLPNFPFGIRPSREAIIEIAQEAERLGYDSVWVTDHILVPRDKPRFGLLFESLSTLAFLGGATQKIQLGTSVLILPYRNAVTVAKQAATIDVLTGGRLIIGVGVGWIEQEFQTMGVDFHRRGQVLDEGLTVLRTLWTQENPELKTGSYHFSDVIFEPRPVRPEGIPIWIGGNSEAALRRVARLGDAWHADDLLPGPLAESIKKLRALDNGRPIGITMRRTIDLRPAMAAQKSRGTAVERWPGVSPVALTGSLEQVASEMSELTQVGLEYFICQFEHQSQQEHLEQMRFLADEIFPRFHN